MIDTANAMYLTQWQVVQRAAHDFRLTGNVYGDPRAPDGARILHTSAIREHRQVGPDFYVRTVSGSVYRLSPSPAIAGEPVRYL